MKMGFHNNGQTSLNNNRSLREKSRWKFEGAKYPMPESHINPDENIDEDLIKLAEKKKIRRLFVEYVVMFGIIIGIFFYLYLKSSLH